MTIAVDSGRKATKQTNKQGIYLFYYRLRAGKLEDFVGAIRDIHHQFEWPLPVLSFSAFQQLKRKACKICLYIGPDKDILFE